MRRLALVGCLLAAGCGSSTTTVTVTTVGTGPDADTTATTTTPGGASETLRITSGAMEPTFATEETVVVSLDPTYLPRVGDIVAFHPPAGADSAGAGTCGDPNQGAGHPQACGTPTVTESARTFVRRIVAGPGDTITITNGHVTVNGQRESDGYIRACGAASFCTFADPITIPAGDYFVMGDNRGDSDDSRFWGPVLRGWIIGNVEP